MGEFPPKAGQQEARQEQEEQPCLQLGASAYVQKPVELEKFFAAIADIMGAWLPEGDDSD